MSVFPVNPTITLTRADRLLRYIHTHGVDKVVKNAWLIGEREDFVREFAERNAEAIHSPDMPGGHTKRRVAA